MTKQKAILNLRDEIRGYTNLSTVPQEADSSQINANGDIAPSYLKNHQKHATLDVVRVSQESAIAFDS